MSVTTLSNGQIQQSLIKGFITSVTGKWDHKTESIHILGTTGLLITVTYETVTDGIDNNQVLRDYEHDLAIIKQVLKENTEPQKLSLPGANNA